MANALGTLSSALVIQRALELSFARYPLLKRLGLDLSDEQCDFNQTINTRKFKVATVNDFGTGATDRGDTNIPVTISNFKEVYHKFTPQEYSGTKRDLVTESAGPLSVAIADHIISAVIGSTAVTIDGTAYSAVGGLTTNTNFTNETNLGGAYATQAITYNDFTGLRKTLNDRGVTPEGRYAVLGGFQFQKLLQEPLLVNNFVVASGGESVTMGTLPNVAGFEVFEWPKLPNTGASVAGTKVGFAGVPSSIIFAGRIPKDPRIILPNSSVPMQIGVVTEPGSGMSVMVNEWIDPLTLTANVRLVFMYGVAVGNSNNGQIIRSNT